MGINKTLQGKTIAITGSSRGIGLAVSNLVNESGGNLVLGSRSYQDRVQDNRLELYLDVTREDSVKHFYEKAIEQFGTVDVLINSAGVGVFSSIIDSSTEDFDRMINVNLRGTYLTCKYFGKHMVDTHQVHMINLVSIAGTMALTGCGGYSASKFGVMGLTKVLQAELRGKGIQVTSVIPGSVSSSFWNEFDPKPDLSQMIPVESVASHILYLLHQPQGAYIDEITIMPPLGIL
ncbi:SDR family oxidoreductase [Niallia sp. Krafla_26]|uniref:SDR family oxidoreductase n=1 Tax=Niallia sp. Krafla_26 TaxID=3064703 RepID=UPI003D17616D